MMAPLWNVFRPKVHPDTPGNVIKAAPPAGLTCDICHFTLGGTMIGHGDGTGQRFAHPDCYWEERAKHAEKGRDDALIEVVSAGYARDKADAAAHEATRRAEKAERQAKESIEALGRALNRIVQLEKWLPVANTPPGSHGCTNVMCDHGRENRIVQLETLEFPDLSSVSETTLDEVMADLIAATSIEPRHIMLDRDTWDTVFAELGSKGVAYFGKGPFDKFLFLDLPWGQVQVDRGPPATEERARAAPSD